MLQSSVDAFNDLVLDAARLDFGQADHVSQKTLSGLLDAAGRQALLLQESGDLSFRAHMATCSLPGAGVWLTAPPAEDGREMDSALFKVALRRRLRVPVCPADDYCPCCGGCMDRFGDHALTCSCNGDRTVRHNEIRNQFYSDAVWAGLRPEKEKAGLLPSRPAEDLLPATQGARRPADVWLPRGRAGRGEALDFACSSSMRADLMARTAESPTVVFEEYDAFKRSFKNTEKHCTDQGFQFTPMILDSHSGAWSSSARAMLGWVAQGVAAVWGDSVEAVSLRAAQRISISLHRENARAVMRRIAPPSPDVVHSGWEEAVPDADAS